MPLKIDACMPELPTPRVVVEAAPVMPPGNALVRSLRAIVCEWRLPTRLDDAKDRLLVRVGRPFKEIRCDGLTFRVRRLAADEHFVRGVVDGIYTPAGYEIGPNDVVVDVGGNIGAYAVWAAKKAARGKVITLEPASENFTLLEENLRLNRLTNVSAVQAALADRTGTITLHLAARSSGDHTLDPALIDASRGTETVEAVTLAGLFARYEIEHCDLIKFNCEGGEVPVVLGLDEAIASRLRRIVLGYHADPNRDKRTQSDALVQRLVELGFTIDDYTDVVGTIRGTITARREAAA
ncbi:MAG: FkbM family methyltransferase [Planctomycetaceae bacterium]